MEQRVRCHICTTEVDFVDTVTLAIARCAENAITTAGSFRIVLAGGATPRLIYAAARNISTDWGTWHIYFGDERCLPIRDSGRNDTMAMTSWLDHVPIPEAQIHSIAAHLAADVATSDYAKVLAGIFKFDLVLLGLGEDGHTASLFPGGSLHQHAKDKTVVAVTDAPVPPSRRITLGSHRLSQAHNVFFLIAGESKQQAVRNWRAGADIPARYITPAEGIDVFLTADADHPSASNATGVTST
jgi:6-phosphogluconolactonase